MEILFFFIGIIICLLVFLAQRIFLKNYAKKNKPGNHRCWQCSLYDSDQRACLVILYPRRAYVKTSPFSKCIWAKMNVLKNIREFNIDQELYNVKKDLSMQEKEGKNEHRLQM